jgi:ribonuclease HI
MRRNDVYKVKYMKNMQAWVDGGSRGNPGHAAIGVVLVLDDKTTEHSQYIGIATNNVAEYTALVTAVSLAEAIGVDNLFVRTDSLLMANQVKGLYMVLDEKLKVLYDKVIKLTAKMQGFHIEHIPREQNKEADRLVNEALDGRELQADDGKAGH